MLSNLAVIVVRNALLFVILRDEFGGDEIEVFRLCFDFAQRGDQIRGCFVYNCDDVIVVCASDEE